MIASLFLIPFGTNAGYAISALEALFYQAGLELAQGDAAHVHFAFRGRQRGRPRSLPETFSNVIEVDYSDGLPAAARKGTIQRLTKYVAQHQIRFVMFFDIQPIHPVFRPLRHAGVATIVSYWGAPMSSLMPPWKLALKRWEWFLSRSRLDGLIFESHAMARLATHGRGVPKDIIDVVPLGVDVASFTPQRSEYVYEALQFPRSRKVVVYSGHMERRKGVHVLIEAAIELLRRRKRQDVCFLLCGNKEGQSEEYERLYAGMGLESFIRFGGYRNDLAKIYPSCFCGVIPSSGWDSFPRTSLEMAASGLPVVGSRLGGLPEAILDHETGLLFDVEDAQQLADCIETLLDNPGLAESYGRAGRARCEKDLTLSMQFDRLMAACRRHLSKANAGWRSAQRM